MPFKVKHCWTFEGLEKEELIERLNHKTDANFILIDTIGKYEGNNVRIKGATTIRYLEAIDRRKNSGNTTRS